VPSDLIGVVASAKQYQEDWQKRLRELRTLGWMIEYRRENDGASPEARNAIQNAA
jgi:hypothetical protein